jgi:hypothetical protein
MLLTTEPSLEQITLRLLAAHPQLTAERIRQKASEGGKAYSHAAVYKVLSRLQANGLVVRAMSRYSLSLSWVFDLLTFADNVSRTYFSDSYIGSLIPAAGSKLTWKFSDLVRCNDFWNQLLLALLKHTPAQDVFAWVPYPWFVALQDDRESRLHQAFRMSRRKFYTNFGPAGHFEPAVRKLYKHKNQTISFARGPLAEVENSYIDVIGDYILTVTLPSDAARNIQRQLHELGENKETTPGKILSVISAPCKIKVVLECSPKKASRLKRDFLAFFAI